MPWPADLVKFVRIGRVPGNEIVLDDPRVSSRHARLMIVGGSSALIEDLGSSNGTFLNSADVQVTRLTPISTSDTMYFGSMAVPASQLLAGLLEAPAPASAPPVPGRATPSRSRHLSLGAAGPSASSKKIAGFSPHSLRRRCWRLIVLIAAVSGRQAVPRQLGVSRTAITATTFALALAAVWLGCSFAVAELAGRLMARPPPRGRLGSVFHDSRYAPGHHCLGLRNRVRRAAGDRLLGGGLKGPWLAMLGVLMASVRRVAVLLGLLVSIVVKSWQTLSRWSCLDVSRS